MLCFFAVGTRPCIQPKSITDHRAVEDPGAPKRRRSIAVRRGVEDRTQRIDLIQRLTRTSGDTGLRIVS